MIRSRKGWGEAGALASRLKDRITIEAPVETDDAQGGVVRSWAHVVECFAEVAPLYTDAAERLDAQQLVTRMQYRVTLRRQEGITAGMRVVWQGRYFNIRAVVPTDVLVELLVEEGVAI